MCNIFPLYFLFEYLEKTINDMFFFFVFYVLIYSFTRTFIYKTQYKQWIPKQLNLLCNTRQEGQIMVWNR